MTSPGDEPPDVFEQGAAEGRRLRDFVRTGQGPIGKTRGGCGSVIMASLLVGAVMAIARHRAA